MSVDAELTKYYIRDISCIHTGQVGLDICFTGIGKDFAAYHYDFRVLSSLYYTFLCKGLYTAMKKFQACGGPIRSFWIWI